MKRDDIYYEAMIARDHRFDGKFFVGVKTTGIYCRPICPAKPKRENVEFFHSSFETEKAGYRPCLRCRPESAPASPVWMGKSAVVRRALKLLLSVNTLAFNEDSFAERVGITARHLRRLFVDEIGKTPKQILFENRLNLARKLISETGLSITEIAFASGFASIRRFNDAFKDRFKKSPREIRRTKINPKGGLKISLSYRPPFDFEGLMKHYENHRIGNLERFIDQKMYRVISFNGQTGQITIANDTKNSSLLVEIDFPDTSLIPIIITRVRNLFDLDSDPLIIANSLESDPAIQKILKAYPGIRLPSGWDPFEIAVSAILGQLVSVQFGRRLVHDLIEITSKDPVLIIDGISLHLFPSPLEIINADLSGLKTTSARKQSLIAFAKAVKEGQITLEPTQNVDEFLKKILTIKGIGIWTASYIAMKALRSTDIFPSTDLVLARALEIHPQHIINTMSPWRAYVAALLWRTYAGILKNTKNASSISQDAVRKTASKKHQKR